MQLVRIIVPALALAAAACGKKANAGKDAPPEPTIAVPTVAVALVDAPVQLTLTGTIVPQESSDVAADVAGKVVGVMVERGDTVKAGDPLIRIDTRNAQLGAREANANLAAARAQKQLAQDECARAQALFDKGAITKSQFEREQTECTAALQQVAAAEARTQMITKSISDGLVRAPFAGTVSDRWISPGEWVGPGVRLVTLVNTNPLKVELTVPESEVPKLALDQAVTIAAVAWKDKTFDAKITRKGAEIGRQTRALIAEATIAPGTPLVPGMFVEAVIQIDHKPQPTVPATAVVHRGQTDRLFVVVDGRVAERVVQTSASSVAGMVAVIKGLKDGEQVVVTAADKQVTDGVRIGAAPATAKN